MNDLLNNIDHIHTTALGVERIKRNLGLNVDDVVGWCKQKIAQADDIFRKGKNWYVYIEDSIITINAYSYTIITAHRRNSEGVVTMINSQKAEEQAVLQLAYAICAAARTAPKACGIDQTDTAVLIGEDKDQLAEEMRRIGKSQGDAGKVMIRDAGNVDACGAVVLVGSKYETRGLNERCQLCGFENCATCQSAKATCVFASMDLGIALGSAVALAADHRIDNRIMFTIGKAASSLGLLGDYKLIMGLPLAVSGKSPFFDRK